MPDDALPQSSIILYQTEDGRTRIQCRFEDDTIWLTQALIAELFQITVPTVNEHLKGIYTEGELATGATIRKFRIVRSEGARQVTREIEHSWMCSPFVWMQTLSKSRSRFKRCRGPELMSSGNQRSRRH